MARRRRKASAEDRAEGRHATQPRDIPAKGWRQIALRVKDELSTDNISIIAAGIAFYGLLAIFPAIAALVSIYGLIANPANIENHLSALSSVMPAQAWDILNQQLNKVASGATGRLTFGFLLGLGLALWSATSGIKTLMTALNITYDEEETRGFIKFNAIALLMTLGAILFAIVAIGLVIVLPALFAAIGLGQTMESLLSILRWPLLALAVVLVLAVVYRYAPDRDKPKWRWVSWGSVVATVLWIVASVLFSFYVSNFGSYNETYGSLGAVVILLMWFYISAYLVLLGAELNAEMEHQTTEDTTRGPGRPMGKRDAYVADTVADSR
jgi:membrane protein